MATYSHFLELLKDLCDQKGWTLEKLAEEVGAEIQKDLSTPKYLVSLALLGHLPDQSAFYQEAIQLGEKAGMKGFVPEQKDSNLFLFEKVWQQEKDNPNRDVLYGMYDFLLQYRNFYGASKVQERGHLEPLLDLEGYIRKGGGFKEICSDIVMFVRLLIARSGRKIQDVGKQVHIRLELSRAIKKLKRPNQETIEEKRRIIEKESKNIENFWLGSAIQMTRKRTSFSGILYYFLLEELGITPRSNLLLYQFCRWKGVFHGMEGLVNPLNILSFYEHQKHPSVFIKDLISYREDSGPVAASQKAGIPKHTINGWTRQNDPRTPLAAKFLLLLEGHDITPDHPVRERIINAAYYKWGITGLSEIAEKMILLEAKGVPQKAYRLDEENDLRSVALKLALTFKRENIQENGGRISLPENEMAFREGVEELTYLHSKTGGKRFSYLDTGTCSFLMKNASHPLMQRFFQDYLTLFFLPEPGWNLKDLESLKKIAPAYYKQSRFRMTNFFYGKDAYHNSVTKVAYAIADHLKNGTPIQSSCYITDLFYIQIGRRVGLTSLSVVLEMQDNKFKGSSIIYDPRMWHSETVWDNLSDLEKAYPGLDTKRVKPLHPRADPLDAVRYVRLHVREKPFPEKPSAKPLQQHP